MAVIDGRWPADKAIPATVAPVAGICARPVTAGMTVGPRYLLGVRLQPDGAASARDVPEALNPLKTHGTTNDPEPVTRCRAGHEYPRTTPIPTRQGSATASCAALTPGNATRTGSRLIAARSQAANGKGVGENGWCHSHYRNWKLYGDPQARSIRAAKYAPEVKAGMLIEVSRRYHETHPDRERNTWHGAAA